MNTSPARAVISWSSGKDSAWMLHVLTQQMPGAAAALLTTINEKYDRVAMHAVRADVLAPDRCRGG